MADTYEYELCTSDLTLTTFEYERCAMKGFRVIVNDSSNKKPLYVTIAGSNLAEIVWPQLSLVAYEYELCGYSDITLTTFEYELCTIP